jgi:predicted double-glycine peptidase
MFAVQNIFTQKQGSNKSAITGLFGLALARPSLFLLPAIFAVIQLGCFPAHAGALAIPGFGGGDFKLEVESKKEARWDTVIQQQYDYSCGSAALATLLTYHYDMPTPEAKVFEAMFKVGNKKKIKSQGFSMLDMKHYLDSRGLNAGGFRMTLDQFMKIGVPGITVINTKGYKHFVVIKGIEGERVLVGDPAAGTAVVSREVFEGMWNGAILAAKNNIEVARANFNAIEDWRSWPDSPLAEGVDRSSISSFTLSLPGRNEQGR